MSRNPLSAFYSRGPIKDLAKLAEVLDLSTESLLQAAKSAERSYSFVPQRKKDGSLRETWNARPLLKSIQQRIKTRILAQAWYPLYLQGGIRDRKNPRDYAQNAAIHAGQKSIINEDIADFYPSVRSSQVFAIWREFFRFGEDVSETLTSLTTRKGVLPQGAKTSSYLANLAFWRTEPEFVRHVHSLGYRYSRLADDVTISSPNVMTNEEKSAVMSRLYTFMKREGFRPKYRKHTIHGAHQRMLVNNLVVNVRAALPIEERKRIRRIVYLSSRASVSDVPMAHVKGKLGKLSRFHPAAACNLAKKLRPPG
jgi:hypothetical protein